LRVPWFVEYTRLLLKGPGGSYWFAVAALALVFLGLAVPSEIGPANTGTFLLRSLLIIDGLLLAGAAIFPRLRRTAPATGYDPLWSRANSSSSKRPEFSGYGASIGALLVLAAALRFISLDSGLWMDEVFSLVRTIRPSAWEILSGFVDDNQHTLYSLAAKGCIALFGEIPVAIRLPAVVFGVASIWATAQLAQLVFGRREAVLAATLLTLSYHHVWFSQNARGYTIVLFTTVLSTYLMLKGLEASRRRWWLGYAVVSTLGAWAHLTSLFVTFGQGVVLAALVAKHWRTAGRWRLLVPPAFAAWLTLHCYSLAIPQMYEFFSQPGAGSSIDATWRSPLWFATEMFTRLGVDSVVGWIGLALIGPIAALGAYWLLRQDALFLSLAIAPSIIAAIVMLALGRSLWPRMFFSQAGFAVIVVSVSALAIADHLSRRFSFAPKFTRLALPAALCVLLAVTLPLVYRYPKQDYVGARDFVRANRDAQDQVAPLHMAGRVYNLYYAPEWPEISTAEQLRTLERQGGDTWVIYTLGSYVERAKPDLARILRTDYELMKTFPGTLGDGDLFVLRNRQSK